MRGDRFDMAAQRFKLFFDELRVHFLERDDVLAQIALALLSREHVLMTGPPGTAKSSLASAVLGRIVDETTGEPSVFARQFTENTIQTDLVGPIDFKTLLETGRTEHFVDEGMLGAVHAFLDEVFDGRDMLLRSTLNVLQERELKQGVKTARGRIECAVMTTNRYLAEVLEGSREMLLAFVDRIAFVSFVPRGFAEPGSLHGVLRKQVGTPSRAQLRGVLTIQDLDALQAATDDVFVPDEVVSALVSLLGAFAEEAAAAERADPDFMATRYLSTRTAVRMGRLLKAVCVYDRIFRRPDRSFEVTGEDLPGVRYGLLLCGPTPEQVAQLSVSEPDSRERRQLAIVRTERVLFDRVLGKVGKPAAPSRRAPAVKGLERAKEVASKAPQEQTAALVQATRTLAVAADTRDDSGRAAAELLEQTVRELTQRALGLGLAPGLGDAALDDLTGELMQLAGDLEQTSGQGRPMARWLRGRAAQLVDEAARLAGPGIVDVLATRDDAQLGMSHAVTAADKCAAAWEKLAGLRAGLRSAGAEVADPAVGEQSWQCGLERLENDLFAILDAGFRAEMKTALSRSRDLDAVLNAIGEPLRILDQYGARVAAMGRPSQLKARVVGPRILPLVAAAFDRMEAPTGPGLLPQVARLLDVLREAGLSNVLSCPDLLGLFGRVLVRHASGRPATATHSLDLEGYRAFRKEARFPVVYSLLELALRLLPARPDAKPSVQWAELTAVIQGLPSGLADQIAKLDMTRLEDTVAFLERWWEAAQSSSGRSADPAGELQRSGFFQTTHGERALLRISLELKLVGEMLPQARDGTIALAARAASLSERCEGQARALIREQADSRWSELLQTARPGADGTS